MKVRNLTTDNLGWQGRSLPAGQVVDVPADTAAQMVAQCPDKFALVPEPAQDTPPQPRLGRRR